MFKAVWLRMTLVIVLMALVFGSCLSAAEITVTVAQGQTFFSLDGGIDAGRNNLNILLHIYDSLFLKDKNGVLQPSLATSYKLVAENRWRITLRQGVKFHNGDPFTAEDVKFSIERIFDPKLASQQRTYYAPIAKIEVVDTHTVDVVTKYPDLTTVERLSLFPVVPARYTKEKGADYLGLHPVGTGPYVFETWVKDGYVSVKANPNHWRGEPSIKRIVFRQIPDDSTRVAALLSGEVDIITAVPPERIAEIKKQAKLRVDQVPSIRGIIVYINTLYGPFADIRVRQALNYAVDVQEIIDYVLGGNGWPITNLVPSMYLGYDKSIKGYRHNMKKARELLAQAGYPNGFPIRLYVPSGRYLKDVEVGQAIAGQLSKAGFKVEVQPNEWATHINLVKTSKDRPKDPSSLFLMGYGAPVYDCGLPLDEWLGTNSKSGLWRNQEFNSLIDKGMANIDREARRSFYSKAHAVLVDQAPAIFLYQQADVYGVNKRVNWKARNDEAIYLFDVTARNK